MMHSNMDKNNLFDSTITDSIKPSPSLVFNKTEQKKKKKKRKVQLTDHDISIAEQTQIKQIFHNLFLFDTFPEEVLDLILGNLFLLEVLSGSYLYQTGFVSQFFYIVLEGTLEVYKDDKVIKVYNQWDSFGHSSLITLDHFVSLDESVKCISNTKLFVLNGETFISIKQKLIRLRLQERYEFINTIIFFKALDSIIKHNIAEKMNLVTFDIGTKIISKGEAGNNIYMIKEGSVSCQINNTEINCLGVSQYFGIVSLVRKSKRTLDVIATKKCICFELTSNDLTEAIGVNYIEVILYSIFKEFLFQNAYFSDLLTEDNSFELFKKFSLRSYEKNDNIYLKTRSKLSNKRIIVVLEGSLKNSQSKKVEYKSGSIIGEEMVKNYIDLPENLVAYPDCLTLETDVDNITQLLGEEIHANTLNIQYKVSKLQKMSIFSHCSENIIQQIIINKTKQKYPRDTIIIKEDSPGDFFYIIIKGKVEVSILNRPIRRLENNSFFGEISLLNPNKLCLRTATVKTVSEVICFLINKQDFLLLANDTSVSELLCKQISLQNTNIELNDLMLIKHIGNGKYGSVDLVHNNNYAYAIKSINRKDADTKKRMAIYLQEERRLLFNVDHPLICKIVKSFKNDYFVFLLLEHINGQNLSDYLNTHPTVMKTDEVRFLISGVLLVIDYLHKRQIVHRDIKPNNIMLDKNGYIKLVDFGAAKNITDYCNTIIGTPHYMSPEVLSGKGYSFSCDYWSIGICTFELFYKKYPFGNDAQEVMEIYKEILYSQFKFPFVNNMFASLNNFIEAILEKQVTKRICTLRKIKNLSFFKDFNWDHLIEYKIQSNFKPNVINFDQLKLNKFNVCYDQYVNRDLEIIYNQSACRNYTQEIKDTEWAEEFSM